MIDYYKSLPGKRVGAGVLLFNQAGEILIVKPNYKDFWLIPGGTIDKDESPRQGCVREIKEEIGLDITKLNFICVDYTTANDYKTESFQFVFNGGILNQEQIDKIVLDRKELDEYKFIKLEDSLPLFSEWFRKRLVKCLAIINQDKAIYLEDGE